MDTHHRHPRAAILPAVEAIDPEAAEATARQDADPPLDEIADVLPMTLGADAPVAPWPHGARTNDLRRPAWI